MPLWFALYILLLSRFSYAEECGYSLCDLGKPDYLNVHLIPHTHDDVGWLKNIDQYYYGTDSYYQEANVELILDSVIRAMIMDPSRKFTYVEMAFFERWWSAQTKEVQGIVRSLVRSGQLEFALGGWTMNDEATVHYADSIDQMTRGLAFLNATFGECGRPRVAWQIDAFGHAQDQARMFIESGFDAVFFQRMDYREKLIRTQLKTMELLWRPDMVANSIGLFTHILFQSYCSPQGFCYDSKCREEPIVDDKTATNFNAEAEARKFVSYARTVAKAYRTNHIFVPMGCDFTFENANKNYKSMDRLIQNVNALTAEKINLLYSSPTCYTKAVNQEFNKLKDIPERFGDFFPYVSGIESYWTGYYSSRPALKKFVRDSSGLLAACELAHLLSRKTGGRQIWLKKSHSLVNYTADEVVDNMRRIMGVMQHHDAVTGTEKQHVAFDYAERLNAAASDCHHLIGSVAETFPPQNHLSAGSFQVCDQLNISVCALTASSQNLDVEISIFNPLGWNNRREWLRIPLKAPLHKISDLTVALTDQQSGQPVEFELMDLSPATKNIPERRIAGHKGNVELLFQTTNLKPTGFTSFRLKTERHTLTLDRRVRTPRESKYKLSINANGEPEFSYTPTTGKTFSIAVGMECFSSASTSGTNGAYLFNTKESEYTYLPPSSKLISGVLVTTVETNYSDWATISCRLYKDDRMEVEWTVGPLPHLARLNTDVLIRYSTSGAYWNPIEFFTDSMGRGLIRRMQNHKLYWGYNVTRHAFPIGSSERIEGNHFPIVNRIRVNYGSMQKREVGLGVYTDRAQGGTANSAGVHMTLHRASVVDDGLGVGEPLIEKGIAGGLVVKGIHTLLMGSLEEVEQKDAKMAREISRSVLPLFRPLNSGNTLATSDPSMSLLKQPLPDNIHLLTCTQWPIEAADKIEPPSNSILLRLENIEYNQGQKPTSIDLTDLFTIGKVTKATEYTLTANQLATVASMNRLHWPTELPEIGPTSRKGLTIDIKPGDIKTMILDL